MDDIVRIITETVIAIIAVAIGVIGMGGLYRERRRTLQKILKEEVAASDTYVSAVYKQDFYVKSTHAKYIIGECSSELTKVRVIRTLKDVKLIKIDRVPALLRKEDVAAREPATVEQECFAIPGIAQKRGEYYEIVLGDDQIFNANTDQSYLINFKLRQSLDKLHPDPNEEGTYIGKPLGTEKFVAEVHFPRTRKLKEVNNKAQLTVYEVRGSKPKKISDKKFTIAAGEIQTTEGTHTDMFRLTFFDPPQDADFIIITWQWSRRDRSSPPA